MAFNQFKEIKKKAYPVIASNPIDAIADAEKLISDSKEKIDIIFFDLPGTMNSKGVVKTLREMDFIFAPISADRLVLASTLSFASSLNENLITVGKSSIKGLYLLWTMVDAREKTPLYDAYTDAIDELGLSVLNTRIPDTKRFRREMDETHRSFFRSTVFPPDKQLIKGCNIEELVVELYQIINA
jgi:cellulose biosynthesis protein BcsQ